MAPPTPTSGDMKLFFFVLKNCKGKPIIDWDAVAAETGLKNADTAKTRYGQVKKKYEATFVPNSAAALTPAKAAPAKNTPPKTGSGVKKATGRVGAKAKTPKQETVKKVEKFEDVDIPGLKVEYNDEPEKMEVDRGTDHDADEVVGWMKRQGKDDDDVFA